VFDIDGEEQGTDCTDGCSVYLVFAATMDNWYGHGCAWQQRRRYLIWPWPGVFRFTPWLGSRGIALGAFSPADAVK